MIHLNNAGAGLMSSSVQAAVIEVIELEGEIGGYEAELRWASSVTTLLQESTGRLLGGPPEAMAFFGSATDAFLRCIDHIEPQLRPGGELWVTPYEYAGHLIRYRRLCIDHDLRLVVIPLDDRGELDLAWVEEHLSARCQLISVTHVPSGCGLINPIEAVGELVREHDAWFVVDGCQAVGQVSVDLIRAAPDLYVGTGRKFLRGPRGTGFAYTSERLRTAHPAPFHDLHVACVSLGSTLQVQTRPSATAGTGLELAEQSLALRRGLAVAVDESLQRDAALEDRTAADRLRQGLTDLFGPNALVDPGTRRSNIVTLRSETCVAHDVVGDLRDRGFTCWVMTGSDTPIFMASQGVDHGIRISPHFDTTSDEIDQFLQELKHRIG